MSITVAVEDLPDAIERRGWAAFVIVTATDARPKVTEQVVSWAGDRLHVEVGRGTALAATAHPAVTLLWPSPEPGGYSLIVDGRATVEWPPLERGDDAPVLRIRPTGAVLHRPAPLAAEG